MIIIIIQRRPLVEMADCWLFSSVPPYFFIPSFSHSITFLFFRFLPHIYVSQKPCPTSRAHYTKHAHHVLITQLPKYLSRLPRLILFNVILSGHDEPVGTTQG